MMFEIIGLAFAAIGVGLVVLAISYALNPDSDEHDDVDALARRDRP
jgi:hypothetical protein